MTTIPCKRPRVLIDAIGSHNRWQADCYVPGCKWSYGNVAKTDVEWQAKNHRQNHRAAVPAAKVYQLPPDGVFNRGYMAECECGWHRDGPGVTTRADNEAALDYHLTAGHGLVTC